MDKQIINYILPLAPLAPLLMGIFLMRKTREGMKKELMDSGMSEKWAEMKSAIDPKIIGGIMIAHSIFMLLIQILQR
jgi:hypothetical protein